PSGTDPVAGSTVNFRKGQNIGNTTIVSLCRTSCPIDGTLAIRSNFAEQHVAIDVQGYFYPQARSGYVWANQPSTGSYTPSEFYAFNSSGGAIGISRQGVGNYTVVFEDLAAGEADGNVVVSAYGAPGVCIVDTWTPGGTADLDLDVEVECYDLSSSPADLRFTLQFTGP
ncbi:MAG: hypothetical protein HRT77_15250, partial [Halioglobus sp.]|nr:hypothetical protein [Halioglobus sp.]